MRRRMIFGIFFFIDFIVERFLFFLKVFMIGLYNFLKYG